MSVSAPATPQRGEPDFVGRGPEFELLRRAQSAAAKGQPGLVLVTGEAGIGKSRLIRQLLRQEGPSGLIGLADPLSGSAVAYGPWLDVFRGLGLAASDPDVAAQNRGGETSDAEPLPSITERLEISRASFLQERFEAISSRTRDGPLTIVLEDLQWADDSSLDLLTYVLRHVTTEPLLIIASIRTSGGSLPQLAALSELLMLPGSDVISLGPLDEASLERVLIATAPHLADASARSALSRIRQDSGGNTFFAVELAAAYPAVPRKLREIVVGRLAQLSPPALAAVRALAVIGRPVPHRLLVDLVRSSGQPESNGELLGPVIELGLVRASDRGGPSVEYEFVHGLTQALTRETLTPQLLVEFHQAAAATLAQRAYSGFATPGELAEHWYRAGEVDRALSAAVRAGVQAVEVVAPAQAELHLSRAVDLWERVDAAASVHYDYADLLRLLAGAKRWLGELSEGIDLLERALALEQQPERRAALLERVGRMRYESGDASGAMVAYQDASALLTGETPTELNTQVAAAQASLLMLAGHHSQAVEAAHDAAARALSIGAIHQAGYALMTEGTSQVALGRVDEGMANLIEAQRLAVESGDVEDQLRADTSLCIALDNQGRLVESRNAAARAFELSREHSLSGSLGISTQANYVEMLWSLGEWTEIDELDSPAVGASGAAQYESFLVVVTAQLEVARGRFAEARQSLDRAEALIDRTQPARFVPLLLARGQLSLWSHDPERAWHEIAECFDLLPELDEPTLLAWSSAVALRAAADGVGARRTEASSVEWSPRARRAAAAARDAAFEAAHTPQAAAWVATARAELARMQRDNSVRLWSDAASQWEKLSRPYEWAYALWRLAEVSLAAHDRESAAQHVNTALALTTTLRAAPLTEELDRLAARARLARSPTLGSPGTTAPWNLTPREFEVLLDICSGISNKQIAAHLAISNRTVGVHVSRVLHKMDVGTRTEAAVKAERAGVAHSGQYEV